MDILEIVQLVIGLLFIASLVAIAVQKLRMPYTVGLVLIGLGLAFTRIEFFPEFSEALDVGGLMVPNLILTPHVAWSSREARQRLLDQLVENILAFTRGEARNRIL